MDRSHHRELIATVAQGPIEVPPFEIFVAPADDNVIDVLEDDRELDIEDTR